MYNRAIVADLRAWADSRTHKPLVLRGARQVGKTSAVRMFGEQFEQCIELNLERPGESGVFTQGLAPAQMLQAILLSRNLPSGTCRRLLFIDEIQACPEAIPALRYFHEDLPDLHVIAAGSLLEAVLARQKLEFPVGRVTFLCMHPLSFREFLEATGKTQALAELQTVPAQLHAHTTLLSLFHTYALLGGMPEVVARYAEGADVAALRTVYQDLLTAFLDDSAKYAGTGSQAAVLRHCIESAPSAAASRITFAGFGNSTYGTRKSREALRALERAMLLRLVYPTTSTVLPLVPSTRKSPRLHFLDTGLVNSYLGLQPQLLSVESLHGVYRGAIAEHIVGQELMAASPDPLHRLAFWVRESPQANAEVDYLVEHESQVVPVEVKAGTSGTLRSLHQFMLRSDAPLAVRMSSAPLNVETVSPPSCRPYRLLNLPYYLAGSLHRYIDWTLEQEQ